MNNLKSIEQLLKEKFERIPEDERDEIIKQLKVMFGLMVMIAVVMALKTIPEKYIEHIMFDNFSTDSEDEQEVE